MTSIQTECKDTHCSKHAGFSTHGARFEAIVVSDKMKGSVVVERELDFFVPKYERYERRAARAIAHNPDCIKAKVGDKVVLRECRPISKLKSFVIVEKVEVKK